MTSVSFTILLLFLAIGTLCHGATDAERDSQRCQEARKDEHICFCGKNQVAYDRLRGEQCIDGQVIQVHNRDHRQSDMSMLTGLRLVTKPMLQSTRDDDADMLCTGLRFRPSNITDADEAYVPLRNVSVEAWINSFTADVTLTQVFVNREENSIEAIYVFPIEENAAVYSFTAYIDNRTITAVLKEKNAAEKEYKAAIEQGHTAVLLQQSKETLDTFTVNVGALPPGKECRVVIRYVTELDLVNDNAIRFVVPSTIAPRYNPSLGHLQSPDKSKSKYVQNTSYSLQFQAHVLRGDEHRIMQVANLSHPMHVKMSDQSIDVTTEGVALDRDIILDVDLPENRPNTFAAVERSNDSMKHAVLLALTPRSSDVLMITNGTDVTNTEFVFIVDCSGSMDDGSKINLAREALLLFIRSLPVGSHFNIIRFGSSYDVLFQNEMLAVAYNEQTAKQAENLTRSMEANFGGTELLRPLEHLKKRPPVIGRSRQVFLLTDGEISNTNEVIELCRSMSATTRIFSFGLGYSPSRALVKGLARATNGYYVFVPPNAKVDTYVGSQFRRALQPSLVNARLEWHGTSTSRLQAPKTIPPVYINDRVLIYVLFDDDLWKAENATVDVFVGENRISSVRLIGNTVQHKDTIRRLAAKALIRELQHEKPNASGSKNSSTIEQRITALSLDYQVLSPYTAFVGVETSKSDKNNAPSTVRHVPIQIAKGDEHLFAPPQPAFFSFQQNSFATVNFGGDRFGSVNSASFDASNFGGDRFAESSDDDGDKTTTTMASIPATSLSSDPVRWLIDRQSFNGAWTFDESDVKTLTNGKSLTMFTTSMTTSQDTLTTVLAIAVLELKYADQKNLWYGVVEKGRKRLATSGLSYDQIDTLINDIKNKL